MVDVANNSSCKVKCWLFAALMGLLAFWLLNTWISLWLGLLLGLSVLVFLVVMLTRLCGVEQHAAPMAAPSHATAAPATKPATAPATAPVTAPVTSETAAAEPESKPVAVAASDAKAADEDYDRDGVSEGENEGTRPASLSAPRDGQADDLKQIKGVGPKLEKMLNGMGFYHFDQISGWSADEVAWVNANLTGFKGRVTRDNWVEQARVLASGGETEFSKRVEDGAVY